MSPARSIFVRHGLRCTKQRLAIYDALAGTASHPTAEQLYEVVRSECEGLSLATVYNTLDALCDAGLCCKLPVTNGSVRYDADLHPHMHVVVEETGEFIDVPDDLGRAVLERIPEELIEAIGDRLGVNVSRVSLALTGRMNGKVNGRQRAVLARR